ncbi:MAG: histidine kinase [Acidobacteria bacterium]|nr:MAG: histidine kinase [Acidobacteriota bacterium]
MVRRIGAAFAVVERRVAQELLDAALLRLAAIIDSSEAAIYSIDLDGTITTWNQAAERLFGFPSTTAIGQPLSIIVPPEQEAEEAEVVRRIRAGEGVEHYETVRRRRDGSLLEVGLTASPIRDRAGVITGVSKIARDITEQRQHERNGRLLASIVESSDDAIISKDVAGAITSWNRGAERLFGYAAEEVIGQSIRIILPADRQGEEDEVLSRIRRGETVDHFETVRCRKDGSQAIVSLTVSPIRDAAGRIVGASKIARDMTQAKRAAERAAFLSEAGKVLARSLDYEATLTTVASLAVPTIADWCAVDVVGEGRNIERLAVVHVDPAKAELAKMVRARYEDPNSPNSVACVVRTSTPALVPLITDEMIVAAARGDQERVDLVRSLGLMSYVCVPLVSHGRTLGALTFATAASSGRQYNEDDLEFAEDVAARAAVAVDNAQAYRDARIANQLKDEFLATLSHELRTPLNAILGYSRLIRSGMLEPGKQARALDTVERNATMLTQIVGDILDVSRIITGKIRLNIQPVDVPAVIKSALETITPAADAKQLRVHTILDPRASPISGDPDRLQQIVWNLVSNAVKFTPKGGRIQVVLERIDSHVEIVVSDTGAGIKAEFLPFVFERFRQGDAGTAREHIGLGLGLAIVRHLVELHGGTVTPESAGQGQGATFRVRLPLMIAHADVAPERARAAAHASSSAMPDYSTRLDGIHVLAVDDDHDALTLIREILETAGARVTTAGSAREVLDGIEPARPDVLVADLGLPTINGFDLIARIRRLPDRELRHIPAAALTAYARSEDRVKAFQSGFQMHLAKPIDPVELIAAIATLAGRNQR